MSNVLNIISAVYRGIETLEPELATIHRFKQWKGKNPLSSASMPELLRSFRVSIDPFNGFASHTLKSAVSKKVFQGTLKIEVGYPDYFIDDNDPDLRGIEGIIASDSILIVNFISFARPTLLLGDFNMRVLPFLGSSKGSKSRVFSFQAEWREEL